MQLLFTLIVSIKFIMHSITHHRCFCTCVHELCVEPVKYLIYIYISHMLGF